MSDHTEPTDDADLRIEVEPGVWLDLRPGAARDANGCDLSLIDACLDKTPYERVLALRGLAGLLQGVESDRER